MSCCVVVFILNVIAECLKSLVFLKFCVGLLVTNCRDFVCLSHSAKSNSPGVSGVRPLLLHVLILAINTAFLTAKLSS